MKRFTETDKWRDTWFRKLKPFSKLAFLYIVDNCDGAGVWDPDYELADFTIGEKIAWPTLMAEFGERLAVLPDGKWHLTRFVEFQYGALTVECRPHVKVLALLKAHGIPYGKGIQRVSIPTGRRQEEERIEQDKAESAPTAEEIYAVYPRKEARKDALKAIEKAIDAPTYPSDADGKWRGFKSFPEYLLSRTQVYAAAVALWPEEEKQYVPHPATWYNRGSFDDDPANWNRQKPGATQSPARIPANLR